MVKTSKTIIFSGGGTLGPVMPLLDIATYYRNLGGYRLLWVGTDHGPEAEVIKHFPDLEFIPVHSGKIRKDISISNLIKNIKDLYNIYRGYRQSRVILKKYSPEWVISAGAYSSVPLHFAAKKLKVKSWLHQLDLQVGLASKVMMPWANKITTLLNPEAYSFFDRYKNIIDNSFSLLDTPMNYSDIYQKIYGLDLEHKPSRQQVLGIINNLFKIKHKKTITRDSLNILVLGGGTGSLFINNMVRFLIKNINKEIKIYHITGYGKGYHEAFKMAQEYKNYHPLEFVDKGMDQYYKKADLVLSRAGMGTIANIIKYQKYSILIPLAGHQQSNATYMSGCGASIVLKQDIKY
jgi:UDP-N-acetylglucosamine--N-acetylmuramyl-(pentapeptide) pyrophosphoryl-undecaprenol N-acetylglucosamine transferase